MKEEDNPMISKLTIQEEVEIAKQMGDYTEFAESEKSFLAGIEDQDARKYGKMPEN